MAVIKHSTVRGYKNGCRCDDCTEANRQAKARERERRREREGKTTTARTPRVRSVPTSPEVGPSKRRPEASGDDLTRIIEEAIWEKGGTQAAAALAATRLREVGYRAVIDEPIEAAARRALPSIGGDTDLATLRRETAYRAAAVMDTLKLAPYFKSASEVLVAAVNALLAESPAQDGETGELKELMDTLGSRRRTRGRASMGDAAESE